MIKVDVDDVRQIIYKHFRLNKTYYTDNSQKYVFWRKDYRALLDDISKLKSEAEK